MLWTTESQLSTCFAMMIWLEHGFIFTSMTVPLGILVVSLMGQFQFSAITGHIQKIPKTEYKVHAARFILFTTYEGLDALQDNVACDVAREVLAQLSD